MDGSIWFGAVGLSSVAMMESRTRKLKDVKFSRTIAEVMELRKTEPGLQWLKSMTRIKERRQHGLIVCL